MPYITDDDTPKDILKSYAFILGLGAAVFGGIFAISVPTSKLCHKRTGNQVLNDVATRLNEDALINGTAPDALLVFKMDLYKEIIDTITPTNYRGGLVQDQNALDICHRRLRPLQLISEEQITPEQVQQRDFLRQAICDIHDKGGTSLLSALEKDLKAYKLQLKPLKVQNATAPQAAVQFKLQNRDRQRV